MLIKSITLKNFRQFLGETKIDLSTDEVANITIIRGGNTAGKTALAQSFLWCLYGETKFFDPVMICKNIDINPGEYHQVKVQMDLTHDKVDYTISRTQDWTIDERHVYKKKHQNLTVQYTNQGQQEFPKHPQEEIRKILPFDLALYFFLDGEHIANLTRDLNQGKSKEFQKAVEHLLGLKAMQNALAHLDPKRANSVPNQLNKEINSGNDTHIESLIDEIETRTKEIGNLDERIDNCLKEIESGNEAIYGLTERIRANENAIEYQREIDGNLLIIKNKIEGSKEDIKILLQDFSENGLSFFSTALIKKSVGLLENEEILDKGVPDITSRTIDELIERGECICGEKLSKGDSHYEHLMKLVDFIPPKSISLMIENFKSVTKTRLNIADNYYDKFISRYKNIKSLRNEIDEIENRNAEIGEMLEGVENVGALQVQRSELNQMVGKATKDKENFIREQAVIENDRSTAQKELDELAKDSGRNADIELIKKLALEVFEELDKVYSLEERRMREQLLARINETFKKIYEGGYSIDIDENYGIVIKAHNQAGRSLELEASTAQGISVIFSFIAGIINIAKGISMDDSEEERLLASEPYPLVMDAPLSAFDRRRIETVCEMLPNSAEQLVILIKDVDGEIAEEYLSDHIGKTYSLNKLSETVSSVLEEL